MIIMYILGSFSLSLTTQKSVRGTTATTTPKPSHNASKSISEGSNLINYSGDACSQPPLRRLWAIPAGSTPTITPPKIKILNRTLVSFNCKTCTCHGLCTLQATNLPTCNSLVSQCLFNILYWAKIDDIMFKGM